MIAVRGPLLALFILGAVGTALAQDISVSVLMAPQWVPDTTNATVTVQVANLGPSAASNIVISNTFSGPATFVSATLRVGSCSGTGPITCAIPLLYGYSSEDITIVLKATAVGT